MSVLNQIPDYYPQGISVYVPEMSYASDVKMGHKCRAYFGAPAVAAAADVYADLDSDGAATASVSKTADATYGRIVQCTAEAAVGTGTATVITVNGEDYLGQPMTETISVAHASGTNAVLGLKAFKRVFSVASDGGGSAATVINIGWGPDLGLPYVTVAVERELEDNVAAAAGTLQVPIFTDPQTATTGDPRGTYTPTGTLDGSAVFEADLVVTPFVNSSGNGGLHGIAHYKA